MLVEEVGVEAIGVGTRRVRLGGGGEGEGGSSQSTYLVDGLLTCTCKFLRLNLLIHSNLRSES
jgi:hypothetical protein